jgi:uncharacterized membrane protein/putative flippase GtrA
MTGSELVDEYLAPGSRNRRLLQYVLVGALGLGVNQGVLFLATGVAGLSYVIGGTLSRVLSVLTNYAVNDAWTWGGRGGPGAREYVVRGVKYVLTRIVGIGIGLAALVLFVELLSLHYLVANVLAVGVGIVWGFGASERWVWRSEDATPTRFERALKRLQTRLLRLTGRDDWDRSSRSPRRERLEDRRGGSLVSASRRRLDRLGDRFDRLADRTGRSVVPVFRRGLDRVDRVVVPPVRRAVDRLGALLNRLADRLGDRIDRVRTSSAGTGSPAVDGGQVQRRIPTLDRHSLRERLVNVDRATLAVFALAGGLFVAFTVYTSLLYRGYQLTGADFGSYLHMFWTTVNGHGFLQQGKFRAGHPSGVYWGAHFSLTLLAYLPFFAVWQSPYALLVAKSFVLAASVPLLWFVAREHIQSTRLAGLVVLSYAFNPFLWSAWAFDFQEQSLLPLLVFVGYLLYARGRRVGFLVFLLLAMFTNEFVVPVAFGFLLGLGVSSLRDGALDGRAVQTLVAGVGLAVVAHVVAGFVMGQFSTTSGVPVRVLAPPFQPFFEGARASLGQLIPIALTNPDVAFRALAVDIRTKVIYLVAFSLPLLFVAYADEVTLGSLAPFVGFAWLVSNRASYVTFRAHYPLYLLPFVYIGAVRALGRWGHLLPQSPKRSGVDLPWTTAVKLVVALLLVNAGVFVVIGGGNMKPVDAKTDHHEVIQAGLASVPEDASVVTQNDLYPHVARRPAASFIVTPYEFDRYEREVGPIAPEYIVYDTELRGFWVEQVLESFDSRIGTEYQLYRYEDGFWVFKRGYEGTPTALTTDRTVTWVADDHEFEPSAFTTQSTTEVRGFVVSQGGEAGERIWYGPYAVFAPGTYTATFRVYATGTGDRPAATVDVAVGDSHRVVARERVASKPGVQEVTVRFTLDRPTDKVEFRGAHAAPGGTVAFGGVTVDRQDRTSTDAEPSSTTATADVAVDHGPVVTADATHVGPGPQTHRPPTTDPRSTLTTTEPLR